MAFNSRLWLDCFKILMFFVVFLKRGGPLGHKHKAADSHSRFFGKEQNQWIHQLQQIVPVLKQQSSHRSSHYHHHVLLSWFKKVPIYQKIFLKTFRDHFEVFIVNGRQTLCLLGSAVRSTLLLLFLTVWSWTMTLAEALRPGEMSGLFSCDLGELLNIDV